MARGNEGEMGHQRHQRLKKQRNEEINLRKVANDALSKRSSKCQTFSKVLNSLFHIKAEG